MRLPHFIHKIISKYKYGITCCDAANLYAYLAKQIVNGMQYMLDNQIGYPCKFKSEEEWLDVIKKIQKGFKEWILDEQYCQYDDIEYKANEKKFKETLKLFSKYYMYLWN